MIIDSGLSGYNYPNRTVEIDRKQEEAQPSETRATTRLAGAITGSSTFPSSSLASALWVMGSDTASGSDFPLSGIAQDWVQGAYQEFA